LTEQCDLISIHELVGLTISCSTCTFSCRFNNTGHLLVGLIIVHDCQILRFPPVDLETPEFQIQATMFIGQTLGH